MFMLGLLAVYAEGDQNFDVLIGNPLTVQTVNQQRKVYFTARISGNVRGDDHHFLTRPEGG